jgi:hypothetical protein
VDVIKGHTNAAQGLAGFAVAATIAIARSNLIAQVYRNVAGHQASGTIECPRQRSKTAA